MDGVLFLVLLACSLMPVNELMVFNSEDSCDPEQWSKLLSSFLGICLKQNM